MWTEGRRESLIALTPKDAVLHNLGPEPIVGPDGAVAFWEAVNGAFEKFEFELHESMSEGDQVMARGTLSYRHRASGRPIHMHGFLSIRFRDGLVAELWQSWDLLGVMIQAGAAEPDAFAAMLAAGTPS
ncbi:MAG: nuclear transport factor 2 family protein [Myxococcota bacterium]